MRTAPGMGGGIAMNFANVGIQVTVVEVAQEALDRGLGVVRKHYENTAAKRRLTVQDVVQRMGLITGTTDFSAVADADVIIEPHLTHGRLVRHGAEARRGTCHLKKAPGESSP